jgi:hypothetical protein
VGAPRIPHLTPANVMEPIYVDIHHMHLPAQTGRKDAQVLGEVLDALAAWLDSVIATPRKSVL